MAKKVSAKSGVLSLVDTVQKMRKKTVYHLLLWIFGLPTMVTVLVVRLFRGTLQSKGSLRRQQIKTLLMTEEGQRLRAEVTEEILRKNEVFGIEMAPREFEKHVEFELIRQAGEQVDDFSVTGGEGMNVFGDTLKELLLKPTFLIFSLLLSPLMYLLVAVYRMPYVKFVFERFVMMAFVLFGVTLVVFTIIYISPSDPAASILGPEAPQATIENFKRAYGLDEPYHVQLWNTFRKVLTFDLGSSYVGNQDIAQAIMRRFPVTLQVGLASLFIGLFIAIPAGIIAATKQYSGFDYAFMVIALLGLSIPNFWLGLMMILEFSVKLKWLPALFQAENYLTMLMPAIVVGTGLSATMARMTRSSMLEVARQDYITMARAKGLRESRVVLHHMLKNALLPIITVLGMQFAAVLSNAATTEKVFNIRGMCEYIATATLLPDTPVVIAGVIYIAVAISISNLIVDILYTFVDPRLKTRIKNY
jgi:peptide/nickel transport system permease protein